MARFVSGWMDDVRQRADIENATGKFPDAEILKYINQSYCELYDILISSGSQEYFYAQSEVITSSGVDAYSLPSDFYKMLGVDANLGGSQYVTLVPYNFHERNKYRVVNGWMYGNPIAYRLRQNQIHFLPTPSGSYNVTLHYVPNPPTFTLQSGEVVWTGQSGIDGYSGWEEFIVVDAAIKCLQKEESDVSVLMARKAELKDRILGLAQSRDAGAPERVRDVGSPGMWI